MISFENVHRNSTSSEFVVLRRLNLILVLGVLFLSQGVIAQSQQSGFRDITELATVLHADAEDAILPFHVDFSKGALDDLRQRI